MIVHTQWLHISTNILRYPDHDYLKRMGEGKGIYEARFNSHLITTSKLYCERMEHE